LSRTNRRVAEHQLATGDLAMMQSSQSSEVDSDCSALLLRVRDLRTHFRVAGGVLRAVDGVSFDLASGETLGLVGESGCGKTTLGRTILRLIPAAGGRVAFAGTDLLAASARRLRDARRKLQMVFQDPFSSLNPRMTVGGIIAEPLAIHRVGDKTERRRQATRLLERVGLRASDADRYPHEFSGGQRQRIGIARAIALKPRLLICDEPVSALDVSVQSQILNLLSDLRDELGLACLFITHDLAVVRHFSDRVAVMYLGKIVETAAAADLYARPGHPYTRALLAAVPQPDPTRKPRRRALTGEPPSPLEVPDGCALAPRCPLATARCERITPSLEHAPGCAGDHRVACHHAERVLSHVEDVGDAPHDTRPRTAAGGLPL
jgi:oligopeptide/dipeptide ABC transporter ATP-binding protein